MKGTRWFLILSFSLVTASTVVYLAHFLIFHDVHHIFIYLIGDIAFVPLEVLLVTIIIHKLLERKEKRSRLEKINMVIGVFFTEIGSELLRFLSGIETPDEKEMENLLSNIREWKEERFDQALRMLSGIRFRVVCQPHDLEALKVFLAERKEALVRLLENPNLLEHENFTELLWALTHVVEELGARADLEKLNEKDLAHLNGDVNRAYAILVREWILYMEHLKKRYPYLFSFALRTNPFDDVAAVEFT
jgi:hypothetical protein